MEQAELMDDLRYQRLDELVSFFQGVGPVVNTLSQKAVSVKLESFMDMAMEQLIQKLTRSMSQNKAYSLLVSLSILI